MLHHLTLWVPDLERAERSWSWLLGELGYVLDRSVDRVVLFRDPSGFALALEQSSDMVPGMLYSRLRPGSTISRSRSNPMLLSPTSSTMPPSTGGRPCPPTATPSPGERKVGYLEDRDGFEVELVAPVRGSD